MVPDGSGVKHNFYKILLVGVALLGCGGLAAAQSEEPLSLSVSPPTFELSANPGDSLSRSIRIDNLTDQPLDVTVDTRNFTALGQEGQVDLTEDETAFSLASWIQVTPAQTKLAAKGSRTFTFKITVPENGEPGGHFGSIVFRTSARPAAGASSNLAVAQEIGTLIFLKVAGETNELAQIENFRTTKGFWESGPVKFETQVRNAGNVHFKPAGTVTIANMFGRKVATIPLESRNVLPDSIRKYQTEWQPRFLLGRYTATLSLVYGEDEHILTATTTFIGFPLKLALGILIVIAIAGWFIYRGRARLSRSIRILIGKE